ncbi:hypothetical protein BDQ17DRAFT_162108 [Cyathus striatus]|nr:hypothetical protein BDQ17DRAFT_162108 [Cyathus striatus]
MVPEFLQRTLAKSIEESSSANFPTRLGDLMRKSLVAEYDIDIMGTLESANAGSITTRPVGGMSQIINILESECRKGGVLFQYCALVKNISRSRENSPDKPPIYEIACVTTRGRILAGSDTLSAQDFDGDATINVIKARAVVIAIPPSAITRIVHQDLPPSNCDNNILRRLADSPIFRSCFGIPAFRAAALYSHPWWDDAVHGLQPLGDRGALLTSTSRLSMLLPYSGRGPNGEAALHLSYCNDFDARHGDGFWSECIKSAVTRSGKLGSDYETQSRRPHAVDKIMYQHIREELAKAFVIPPEDIPDPIKLEWHYWDDGAVHVQQPIEGHSSISRKTVEDWAVNGPLISHGPEGVSGDRIVLVGEGFAEKWAWVEGALVSATRAAETILNWSNL